MDKNTSNHQRILAHIYGQPWLISRAGLTQVGLIAERQGDVEAVLARRGQQMEEGNDRVVIRDRVAVLSVRGPIFRYANLFTRISGAAAVANLATDFQALLDNPAVAAIILDIDSPGGQAAGINEFAQLVYAARGKKQITAYVGHTAASAAYWIASATEALVIDPTAALGSIGVVIGVRKPEDGTLEIVSSRAPNKRLDPSSEAGQARILAYVDDIEAVFFAMVARNRGVSVNRVEADFGQGGMLVGEKAIAAGMADRLGSLEGLIEELNQAATYNPRPAWPTGSIAAAAAQSQQGVQDMDLKELKAKYPEACQALIDEGRASGKEEAKTETTNAVTAERARVLALAGIQFGEEPGAAFANVVNTGVSEEQLKAIRAATPAPAQPAAAQPSAAHQQMLDAINQAGAPNPGAGGGASSAAGKDFEVLVADYQAQHPDTKRGQAIQAVMRLNPAAHQAWLAKKQAG